MVVQSITTQPAPEVTGLAATPGLKGVNLSWNPSNDPNKLVTEVWRSTTNNSATATWITGTNTDSYTDLNVVSGTTYYYWIRTRSTYNTVSDFSPAGSGVEVTTTQAVTADITQGAVTDVHTFTEVETASIQNVWTFAIPTLIVPWTGTDSTLMVQQDAQWSLNTAYLPEGATIGSNAYINLVHSVVNIDRAKLKENQTHADFNIPYYSYWVSSPGFSVNDELTMNDDTVIGVNAVDVDGKITQFNIVEPGDGFGTYLDPERRYSLTPNASSGHLYLRCHSNNFAATISDWDDYYLAVPIYRYYKVFEMRRLPTSVDPVYDLFVQGRGISTFSFTPIPGERYNIGIAWQKESGGLNWNYYPTDRALSFNETSKDIQITELKR